MAELLIKAIDSAYPTIQEYTDILNNKLIPEANAFPLKLVDLQDAFAKLEIIKAGDGNTLTLVEVEEMFWTLQDKPHILYHHNILAVEAVKDSAVKEQELQIKDNAGCYKRGDIVEVFEDGKIQDPPEGSPFVLIRVTGITKAQGDKYIASTSNLRRKFRLHVADLPLAIKQELATNRAVKVTLAQVKPFIRNKVTKVTKVDEA